MVQRDEGFYMTFMAFRKEIMIVCNTFRIYFPKTSRKNT